MHVGFNAVREDGGGYRGVVERNEERRKDSSNRAFKTAERTKRWHFARMFAARNAYTIAKSVGNILSKRAGPQFEMSWGRRRVSERRYE